MKGGGHSRNAYNILLSCYSHPFINNICWRLFRFICLLEYSINRSLPLLTVHCVLWVSHSTFVLVCLYAFRVKIIKTGQTTSSTYRSCCANIPPIELRSAANGHAYGRWLLYEKSHLKADSSRWQHSRPWVTVDCIAPLFNSYVASAMSCKSPCAPSQCGTTYRTAVDCKNVLSTKDGHHYCNIGSTCSCSSDHSLSLLTLKLVKPQRYTIFMCS